MKKRNVCNFRFENKRWKAGYKFVAGIDEVGRGCFAGPIVAAAVVFAPNFKFHQKLTLQEVSFKGGIIINDSKLLSSRQRERANEWIKENALAWGVGEVSAGKINNVGMASATRMAFRRAVAEANKNLKNSGFKNQNLRIEFLLADAFFTSYVPGLPTKRRKDKKGRYYKKVNGRQDAIVNGDEKSVSIAAASMVAKVYRDKLMTELSKNPRYQKYLWNKNKGYGTLGHRNVIKRYGITRLHRKQFVETFLLKLKVKI
jgi:ribonuclease HII